MSQEPEIKAAIISSKSGVWIAIIGLLGGLLIAILPPFAEKWANRFEPTPNPSSLAIEQLPVTVFIYDGRDENLGGWSNWILSYLDSFPNYNSIIPYHTDQTGYAGIAFRFSDGQNLSKYQRIEFTIQFDGKESQHVMDLYLTDISGQKGHVRMTEIGGRREKRK